MGRDEEAISEEVEDGGCWYQYLSQEMFQQGDFSIEVEESRVGLEATRKVTEALESTRTKKKIILYPKIHNTDLYLL